MNPYIVKYRLTPSTVLTNPIAQETLRMLAEYPMSTGQIVARLSDRYDRDEVFSCVQSLIKLQRIKPAGETSAASETMYTLIGNMVSNSYQRKVPKGSIQKGINMTGNEVKLDMLEGGSIANGEETYFGYYTVAKDQDDANAVVISMHDKKHTAYIALNREQMDALIETLNKLKGN